MTLILAGNGGFKHSSTSMDGFVLALHLGPESGTAQTVPTSQSPSLALALSGQIFFRGPSGCCFAAGALLNYSNEILYNRTFQAFHTHAM